MAPMMITNEPKTWDNHVFKCGCQMWVVFFKICFQILNEKLARILKMSNNGEKT